MKTTKKFLSMLLSLVMALVLAVPAFAAEPTPTDYTITAPDNGHTYEVYQIFTGDLANGVLSNVEWGKNGTGETGTRVDADTITALTNVRSNPSDAAKLAVIDDYVTLSDPYTTITEETRTVSVPAGYYLIKDKDGSVTGDDSYTLYIVEVAENVEITPKSGTPEVDKQVHDEEDDAETGAVAGWGETADHAINESFQFKLVATLPEDNDMNLYTKYAVTFVDTWSAGVTFEKIDSVTVNGTVLTEGQYTLDMTENGMTITIDDIVPYLGDGNDLAGTTITVIYSAHLNEKATVNDTSGTTENKNTVKLEYSNNPNVGGEGDRGTTPEDTVWVFTYRVNNTKVDTSNGNAPLAGAGFKLYNNQECTDEVGLIYDATMEAYRPVKGDEEAQEMTSAANTGAFNIIGLDAGTYYLKETTVPAGYNEMTPNPMTITISATHVETSATEANVTLNGNSTTSNTIGNSQGATLPETGGMGTTLFYVIGSILVLGAGVLLVTKKRMSK